jgi:RNA polymerase-binding transcription factor DksA
LDDLWNEDYDSRGWHFLVEWKEELRAKVI